MQLMFVLFSHLQAIKNGLPQSHIIQECSILRPHGDINVVLSTQWMCEVLQSLVKTLEL